LAPVHHREEPSPVLVEHVHLLPKGRVLDLAMGRGRHAIYLAARGFTVEGIDASEESVRWCQQAAAKRGLALEAKVVDLTRYRIPPSSYDVVVCFYYLQRDLVPQIKAALRPGGVLVYETFLVDQHLKFGHPRHREYCLEGNELLRLFGDLHLIYYREGFIEERKATASLVARRLPQPAACS